MNDQALPAQTGDVSHDRSAVNRLLWFFALVYVVESGSVALLRRLPAVIRDSEAEATAAQLALRVGRLRDALEAFGGG